MALSASPWADLMLGRAAWPSDHGVHQRPNTHKVLGESLKWWDVSFPVTPSSIMDPLLSQMVSAPPELTAVLGALRRIRLIRVGLLEERLVDLICGELDKAGIAHEREVVLAPGCRIDIAVPTSGDGRIVGIEAKKGRPRASSAEAQVARYARTGRLAAIVFVAERTFDLPRRLAGVPVATVSLQAAMGIAL
jgi:hypothetical protein